MPRLRSAVRRPPLPVPHTLTGIARSRWRSGKLLQFRSHLRSQVPQRHGGVRKESRVACAGARAAGYYYPKPLTFWQVSQESLRLAQQSITLRKAMAPFDFVSERGSNRCRRN